MKNSLLLVASALSSASAFAADVTVCTYGGTNDPYTAENALVCDNFTYVGAGSGADPARKPDSLASFISGEHWIYGTLKTSGLCNKYTKNADLVISGEGTVVNANNVDISSGRITDGFNKTVDGIPFRTRLFLRDGARLVVSNKFETTSSAWYEPIVDIDGASLDVVNDQLSFVSAANTTRVSMVDAEISVGGNVYFGSSGGYGQGFLHVDCSDTKFTAKSLNFYVGAKAHFRRCDFTLDPSTSFQLHHGTKYSMPAPTVVFEDCTITNAYADKLGYSAITRFDDRGRMTISGGTAHFTKLQVGGGVPGYDSEVTVTNGADVVVAGNIDLGVKATGVVEVVGAKLRGTTTARIGSNMSSGDLTGLGRLRVGRGGAFDVGLNDVYIGYGERGIIEVDGGTVTARNILVGYGASTAWGSYAAGSQLIVRGGTVNNAPDGIVDGWGGTKIASWPSSVASLVLEDCTYETLAIYGGDGTSTLTVDGATIRQTRNFDNRPLISALTKAEVGAKGLVIDIPADVTKAFLTQKVEDKAGESGKVVKTGAGPLRFVPTAWTVSETVVAGGTLTVTNSSIVLDTSLVVTNGATLSMRNGLAGTLTVNSLLVDGGVLDLDPGDKIVVLGQADIADISLNFSAAPSGDISIIECASASARTDRALVRALASGVTYGEGEYGKFSLVETAGGFSVKFSIKTSVVPLSGDALTTWQGATQNGWESAGSWTAGVPEVGKKAVFPSDAAVKAVSVPDGAEATALSFGGDFTVGGEPLTLDGDRGAVEIEATAGTTVVSAPIRLREVASVPVASGARLSAAGGLDDGGFAKTGKGRFDVGASNDLALPVTIDGGVVSAAGGGAFGSSAVTLVSDTLEIDAGANVETVFTKPFTVNATSQYASVILKTETPVTMPVYTHVQGAFLKRGPAPLTMLCRDGDKVMNIKACDRHDIVQAWVEFPENGESPVNPTGNSAMFTAFTIVDGEVVFRPAPGETLPTVNAQSDGTYVGIRNTNGTVRARMTIDGVHYECASRGFLLGGYNIGNDSVGGGTIDLGEELLKSELCITNGGLLTAGKFTMASFGNHAGMTPTLAMTNGTIASSGAFVFSFNNMTPTALASGACSVIRAKDSTITAASGFSTMLNTDGDFDNTTIGTANGTPGSLALKFGASGRMLFRNGSTFGIGAIDFTDFRKTYPLEGETMTLAFDDAEWRYGTGADYVFDPSIPNDASDAFKVEMVGAGVRLCPASGTTFTSLFPFTGAGGIVVDGEGTVAFGAGTVQFAGVAEVKSGTLDLSAAGTVPSLSVKGPGTLYGASVDSLTIAPDVDDEWGVMSVPTLEGCTLGRVVVDCGHAGGTPLPVPLGEPVVVARFTGAAPGVSGWRLKGTGASRVRGVFSVSGDSVVMTVEPTGAILIVK